MSVEPIDNLTVVAMRWLEMSRWDRAEPVLRQILEIDAANEFALDGLATVLIVQHRLDEAEQVANQLVQHNPDNPAGFVHLAAVLSLAKSDDAALEAADQAIRLAPRSAYVMATRAFVLNRARRVQEAFDTAREALQIDPHEQQALGTFALSALKLGLPEIALDAAGELLRLAPVESFTLSIAGDVLRAVGRRPEGMRLLRQLLERYPADAQSHLAVGFAYWDRGDDAAARRHFREALRLNPSLDNVRKLLRMSRRTPASQMPDGWKMITRITFFDEDGHRHSVLDDDFA